MEITTTQQRPRVLLAEDDALIRLSIRRVVEQCCEVIGEASDGGAAIELAEELRPDVVLLDISMPVLNGLEAARRLQKTAAGGQDCCNQQLLRACLRRGGIPNRSRRLRGERTGNSRASASH